MSNRWTWLSLVLSIAAIVVVLVVYRELETPLDALQPTQLVPLVNKDNVRGTAASGATQSLGTVSTLSRSSSEETTELLRQLRSRKESKPDPNRPGHPGALNASIDASVEAGGSKSGRFEVLFCYKSSCFCYANPDPSTVLSFQVTGSCPYADPDSNTYPLGAFCVPNCVFGYTPNGGYSCAGPNADWSGYPCQACGAAIPACASCSQSSRVCNSCAGGYYACSHTYPTGSCCGCSGGCPAGTYLSANCDAYNDRQCAGCGVANCNGYSSGCTCNNCNPGYTGGSCSACNVPNCLGYAGGCICNQCNPGFTGGDCAACGIGNCNGYSAGCTCNNCNPGFSGGSCSACNVAQCNGYSSGCNCNNCNPGYTGTNCGACNVPNCFGYSGGCSCNNCAAGYTGTSCAACNTANCQSYSSGCSCGVCVPGWYASGGSCLQCAAGNCAAYSSQCTCGTCAAAYQLITGTCQVCSVQFCTAYTTNTCTCTGCPAGRFLTSNTCAQCTVSQCNGYSSACLCNNCNPGYSGTGCTVCNVAQCVGYSSGCTCSNCNPGYQGASCAACNSANCQTYTTGVCKCGTCNPGYSPDGNGVCQACNKAQCTTYSSQCTCSACNPGFQVNAGSCAACTNPNCQAYSSVCTCGTCQAAYSLAMGTCSACSVQFCTAYTTNTCTCTGCPAGRFLTSNTCAQCTVSQCNGYSSACLCNNCNPGFSGTGCAVCTVAQCNGYSAGCSCNDCDPGFTGTNCAACNSANCQVYSSGCRCGTCAPGFSPDGNGVCQACNKAQCTAYSSQCTCSTCNSGYTVVAGSCAQCQSPCTTCSGSSTACTACVPGTLLQGNTCPACVFPCTTCTSTLATCTSCPFGYFLQGIQCKPCASPCSSCVDTATRCTNCIAGYYRPDSGTQCFPCSCRLGEYISANCPGTGTTNAVTCMSCAACAVGQYLSTNCTGTSAVSTVGDRTCSACRSCESGFFVSSACTGTSSQAPYGNQVCAACGNRPCSIGSRQTGSVCTGVTLSDTQTCTPCDHGGSSYVCDPQQRTGTACMGLTQADTQTCADCGVANCALCAAGATVCERCGTGYYRSSLGSCSLCGNGGTTYTCSTGFFPTGSLCDGLTTTDTQTCQLCSSAMSQCVQCNSNTQCIRTSMGYYISPSGAGILCDHGGALYSCPDGTYSTGTLCSGYSTADTQSCSSCLYPCARCVGTATQCTSCAEGYQLAIGQCRPNNCPAAPANPMGGTYSVSCTNTLSGQSCPLTCAQGFLKQGSDPKCEASRWTTPSGVMPSCSDINECATNNGGCGAGVCSNIPGDSVCGAVNQCSTNNGFCDANTQCVVTGPGQYECQDLNECATSNGGCGAPWEYLCTNTYGSRVCTNIGACANVTCMGNATCHASEARDWWCTCNPNYAMDTSTQVCRYSPVEASSSNGALSAGGMAGVSLAVILLAFAAAVAVFVFWRRRRNSNDAQRHQRKMQQLTKTASSRNNGSDHDNSSTSGGDAEMTVSSVSHMSASGNGNGGNGGRVALGERAGLAPGEERALLSSFPKRKTTAALDEYFAHLHNMRDKYKALETLSTYVHPSRFSPSQAPEQFLRFCEADNLQRWVFPFLFKNSSQAGNVSTTMSLEGSASASMSTEQSLFELAMVLVVDIHYQQYLQTMPVAAMCTVQNTNGTASGTAGVYPVMTGLERTLCWLRHSPDWVWQLEAIAFTRLILYSYLTKVLTRWSFHDGPGSVAYANLFELCHVIELFVFYSPIEQDGRDSEFGVHVDANGFLDGVLVDQMMKVLQRAEDTLEGSMKDPAPQDQKELLARVQEERDYFSTTSRFFREATAYLEAFEKVDAKVMELTEAQAREHTERVAATQKSLDGLVGARVYQKKKLAKKRNVMQMLDDSMAEIQDLKRQRRGVKRLGAIAGFAQVRMMGAGGGGGGAAGAADKDKEHQQREGKPRKQPAVKNGEESNEDMSAQISRVVEDAHAEDLNDRELKEIRTYFTDANLLGQGAYGRVYKAEFRGEEVAVKVLDATTQSARKVAEAFEKELRVHMHLRSPRLVNIIRVHRKPPEFLMVMECMDRGNLRQFLKDESSVSEAQRLELAVQIMRGVTFLHQNEPPIAHRDLKPENVLVDHSLNCKLCDFGLSALQTDTDAAHKLAGSGLYMAPEVFMMFAPGHASGPPDFLKADMYSLGIVLIELFGAKIPWMGKNFQQIVEAHVSKTPRDVPAAITNVGIRALIQDCMASDPARRPTIRQALKMAQTLQNPGNDKAAPCDECEKEPPTLRCDECQQTLCSACCEMLHKKGKRAAHVLTPFAPSVAFNVVVTPRTALVTAFATASAAGSASTKSPVLGATPAATPPAGAKLGLQPVVMTGGAVRAAQAEKERADQKPPVAATTTATADKGDKKVPDKKVLHESAKPPMQAVSQPTKPEFSRGGSSGPGYSREGESSFQVEGSMDGSVSVAFTAFTPAPPTPSLKLKPSPPPPASPKRGPVAPPLALDDSLTSVSIDVPGAAFAPKPFSPARPTGPAAKAAPRGVVPPRSASLTKTPQMGPSASPRSGSPPASPRSGPSPSLASASASAAPRGTSASVLDRSAKAALLSGGADDEEGSPAPAKTPVAKGSSSKPLTRSGTAGVGTSNNRPRFRSDQ